MNVLHERRQAISGGRDFGVLTFDENIREPTFESTLPSRCHFSSIEVGYLVCLSFDCLCTGSSLWD